MILADSKWGILYSPRHRTVISKQQQEVLKIYFENNKFPNQEEKRQLANDTGLEYIVIANWFQNRRNRWKRH